MPQDQLSQDQFGTRSIQYFTLNNFEQIKRDFGTGHVQSAEDENHLKCFDLVEKEITRVDLVVS